VSVEQNKIVAERFFEEVFNNKKVELVDELVSSDVIDHNKIIFAQPEGPGDVAEGIRMLLVAFPDLSASVERPRGRRRLRRGEGQDGRNQHGAVPAGPRAYGAAHRVGIHGSVPDGGRQNSRTVGHL
jgi:hypothetical protein